MTNPSVFKRKKKNGNFFYVHFVDKLGNQLTAKSVDTLAKEMGYNIHITTKVEAEKIVAEAIFKHLDSKESQEDPLFIDYVLNFWDWDNSKYIQDNLKLKPNFIGKEYVKYCLGYFKNHALPLIPQKMKASQITTSLLEKIQHTIVNEKGVETWKNVYKSLSSPIQELLRIGILKQDPRAGLVKTTVANKRNVAIFTNEEFDTITNYIAHSIENNTIDKRSGLAILLAFYSGMRQGEILGLKVDKIKFPQNQERFDTQALIYIDESYGRLSKNKLTKGKYSRVNTIPVELAIMLLNLGNCNPYYLDKDDKSNAYIFFSDRKNDCPMSSNKLEKDYYDVLNKVGFTAKEIEERKLVFHGIRHWYVSKNEENKIDRHIIQLLVGHRSDAMTENYLHLHEEAILETGQQIQSFMPIPDSWKKKSV